MNHQPFEDWLLDDEPLTAQQERELHHHMHACASCAAIANANLALHSKHLMEPAPGFSSRFQPRLAQWRRGQVRRQAVGTFVLVSAGLGSLYVLAGPAMVQAARSPAVWLREVTALVVSVLTLISVVEQLASILLRNLGALIPMGMWWAILAGGCGLVTIWVLVMRRSVRAPQGA